MLKDPRSRGRAREACRRRSYNSCARLLVVCRQCLHFVAFLISVSPGRQYVHAGLVGALGSYPTRHRLPLSRILALPRYHRDESYTTAFILTTGTRISMLDLDGVSLSCPSHPSPHPPFMLRCPPPPPPRPPLISMPVDRHGSSQPGPNGRSVLVGTLTVRGRNPWQRFVGMWRLWGLFSRSVRYIADTRLASSGVDSIPAPDPEPEDEAVEGDAERLSIGGDAKLDF